MNIPYWLFLVLIFFAGTGLTEWVTLIYEIISGKRKFKGFK